MILEYIDCNNCGCRSTADKVKDARFCPICGNGNVVQRNKSNTTMKIITDLGDGMSVISPPIQVRDLQFEIDMGVDMDIQEKLLNGS